MSDAIAPLRGKALRLCTDRSCGRLIDAAAGDATRCPACGSSTIPAGGLAARLAEAGVSRVSSGRRRAGWR